MTTPRNWRTEEGASSTTSSDSSVIIGTGKAAHNKVISSLAKGEASRILQDGQFAALKEREYFWKF